MAHSSIHPLRRFLIPIGLLLVMLFAGSSIAVGGSMVGTTAIAPHIPGVIPLLSYQGRLVDPATGAPKADGTYEMSFRLYTVASSGTALWTETRDVPVSKGLFSVLLGEITGLNPAHFTGQELWLGIKVGADAEATPRQHLAHVAYALFAENAALLNGQTASAFATTAHAHSGTDITSGTVADGRVAPTLARDNEVFSIITAADGAASGLDADLLDGLNSGAFATAAHAHSGADITSGTVADGQVAATIARDSEVFSIVTGADGAASGLDADLLDGLNSSSFAVAVHNHDAAYINSAGPDAMTGSNASPVLQITQSGDGNGLTASTTSTQVGKAGVSGVAGASGTTINGYSGVLGDSKLGRGVVGVSGSNDAILGLSTSGIGVYGQSIDSYGVAAYSQNNDALRVFGNGHVTGDLTVAGTVINPMVPIALGFITSDGTKNAGSANVSSIWNAANTRYEITLAGYSYFFSTFVTIVTPTCTNRTYSTSSVSGKLLIYMSDGTGGLGQCAFQFVTYKP